MPERVYVPLQVWICEKCLCVGQVEAPPDLTSDQVMLRIHDQHIQLEPACAFEWGVQAVRLGKTPAVSKAFR